MAHSKNRAVVIGTLAMLGCSGTSSSADTVGGAAALGGTSSAASSLVSGGASTAGGSAATTQGGTVTGQSNATGGLSATGGITGSGVTLTGGASALSGGTGAITTLPGGSHSTGGGIATGGAVATGGIAPIGGSNAAGASSSGGTSATGGRFPSGGNVPIAGSHTGGAKSSTATKATGSTTSTGGAAPGSGGTAALGGATGTGGGSTAGIPVGHCGAKKGRYFPESSWIYTDITNAPVRDNSGLMTKWLEDAGGWGNENRFQIDISFVILDADASTPRVAVTANDPMEYSADCDPNVQMPVPANGRIEGSDNYICTGRTSGDPAGDCHMLVADFASNALYEAYQATYSGNSFYSTCNVAWNMTKDVWGAPPAPGSTLPAVSQRNWGIGRDCTGPDAAGFPIAPLLFTIGDVLSGRVEHAIRFALPNDRIMRAAQDGDEEPAYVWPATHAGGPEAYDPDAPIYGSRWRLKADFNPASRGLDPNNPVVKAVVYGLQHYGMLLADGGDIALMAEDGSDCGTTWDDLWGDPGSRVLNGIQPGDFDVIDTGGTDGGWDCVRNTR